MKAILASLIFPKKKTLASLIDLRKRREIEQSSVAVSRHKHFFYPFELISSPYIYSSKNIPTQTLY